MADTLEVAKAKLRPQQDLVYAIIGGLAASMAGALLWAVITVATNYQIGYMALAVGLLVGFSVRFFGAGIDQVFGIVGAFFALLGCVLGNLLSQVGFIADAESLGYVDVLTFLNWDMIVAIFTESFSIMDLVFYGIAAYEGYKFAFRPIPEEQVNEIAAGTVPPLSQAKLRLPIIIGLLVVLFTSFYFLQRGSIGIKTFHYPTGERLSEGMMEYGVENGAWTYWWENGNVQQTGFYKKGLLDSVWQLYNEEGLRYRKSSYKQSLQHGNSEEYYPNGQVSNSGNFVMGRQQGPWIFYFEDGTVSQRGFFKEDQYDGIWEIYHPNGKLSAKGSYNKSEPTGLWTYLNEDGSKTLETETDSNGQLHILNAWDSKGEQVVINGNGLYTTYFGPGQVMETGQVRNKQHTGVWKKFFVNGKLSEEGEYRDGTYYLLNAWSSTGEPLVTKGEGIYESYYDSAGNVQQSGKIAGGLRSGEWKTNYLGGKPLMTMVYSEGKPEGRQATYFESEQISAEGSMVKGKREGEWKWYHENGNVESVVTFVGGLKQGSQFFYDDRGNLLRTEVYVDDTMTSVKAGTEE